MSKGAKIAIIVIGIIAIISVIAIVSVFGIISLVNQEKTPITANQFVTKMEEKSYITENAVDQFIQYDYVIQAYIAADEDYGYQIEFYELSDESTAMGFYDNNVTRFESRKSNSSAETNINLKNFSKYTLLYGGNYMVVSRIENTVVYLNVDTAYKDEVNKILEELGY